jgi:hypothetical protein
MRNLLFQAIGNILGRSWRPASRDVAAPQSIGEGFQLLGEPPQFAN